MSPAQARAGAARSGAVPVGWQLEAEATMFKMVWQGGLPARRRPNHDALHAGGADLVLNGHEHNYERTHPMVGGRVAEVNRRAVDSREAGGDLHRANHGTGAQGSHGHHQRP